MADYLKIPEIAQRLDVSDKTARKYVTTGELQSTYMGSSYRVSEQDLEAFIESRRVQGLKALEQAEAKRFNKLTPEPEYRIKRSDLEAFLEAHEANGESQ